MALQDIIQQHQANFYSLEDIEVFMLRKFERAHKANNRMRMGDISAALEILRELQRGDME